MTVLYVSDEAGNDETISRTIEPGGRYERALQLLERSREELRAARA